MLDRELHLYLKYLHGSYNMLMLLLFSYQGVLGFTIRRHRRKGRPFPAKAVTRHRKAGPVLTVLGPLGFLAGITLVLLSEKHHILDHTLHLFVGLGLVILLLSTFAVSRRIRGTEPSLRNVHTYLGIVILTLYFIQVFIGLGILL